MDVSVGLSVVAIFLYAASWITLVRGLLVGPERVSPSPWTVLTALAGLGIHGFVLYQAIISPTGFALGFFNAASLTTWAIVSIVVVVSLSRPLAALGVFVLPLAMIAILLAVFFQSDHLVSSQAGAGVQLHVVTSLLAASVLAVVAFQASLFSIQERRLRNLRPGRINRVLPPLQLQETLLVQLLIAGFFLLSLSLVSGVVFVQDLLGQHLVHKTVLALLAWVIFAVVLYGRWRHGWRGRTLVRWCIGGFVVLLLAYFGAKWVLEIVLGRSWSSTA